MIAGKSIKVWTQKATWTNCNYNSNKPTVTVPACYFIRPCHALLKCYLLYRQFLYLYFSVMTMMSFTA